MSVQNFTEDPLAWLWAMMAAAMAWAAKTWRADSKESRDLLLSTQHESNQAMHAMAAALDRSTERDRRNEVAIQEINAALGEIRASLQRYSGPQ